MAKSSFLQFLRTPAKDYLGILNWPLLVVTAERRDIEVKGAKAPFFYSAIVARRILTSIKALFATVSDVGVSVRITLPPLTAASRAPITEEL